MQVLCSKVLNVQLAELPGARCIFLFDALTVGRNFELGAIIEVEPRRKGGQRKAMFLSYTIPLQPESFTGIPGKGAVPYGEQTIVIVAGSNGRIGAAWAVHKLRAGKLGRRLKVDPIGSPVWSFGAGSYESSRRIVKVSPFIDLVAGNGNRTGIVRSDPHLQLG